VNGRVIKMDGVINVMKHALIFGAVLLVVVWIFARVALAVTSVALHLLWIVAVVLAIAWGIRKVTSDK
jgi:hypothetical protein